MKKIDRKSPQKGGRSRANTIHSVSPLWLQDFCNSDNFLLQRLCRAFRHMFVGREALSWYITVGVISRSVSGKTWYIIPNQCPIEKEISKKTLDNCKSHPSPLLKNWCSPTYVLEIRQLDIITERNTVIEHV